MHVRAPVRIAALIAAATAALAGAPAHDQTAAPPAASASEAPAPALTPEVMALITPVRDAIVRVRAAQAALPAAADDHETLKRMHELDQAVWQALSNVDFAKIPADQNLAAKDLMGSWIQPVNEANHAALLKILPPEGWFAISRYGAAGEEAAYQIVLHSGLDDWRRFAPAVGRYAAIGEANGGHYALLYDRLAVHEGAPQRYGSQMTCVDGVYKPFPIEDPDHLDERRIKLGLTPYADYLKTFNGRTC